MTQTILTHLKALTAFSGREPRGEFWPYVGLVIAASMIAMVLITVIFILSANDPLESDIAWVIALSIAVIALLAAAVARRLHDRGLSGVWGLLPLPFLAFGFFQMHREFLAFGAGEPDTAFDTVSASVLLYDISLIVLIILLVGRSNEGANRFGPNPRDAR